MVSACGYGMHVFQVECKRSRYLCKKSATCTEDFVVGDYVRLEGDHGNEIGT